MSRFRWVLGGLGAGVGALFSCSSFEGEPPAAPMEEAGAPRPAPDGGTTDADDGDADRPTDADTLDSGLPPATFEVSLEDDCESWARHADTTATEIKDGDGGKACRICAGTDSLAFIYKERSAFAGGLVTVSMRARATTTFQAVVGFQTGSMSNKVANITAGVQTHPAFTPTTSGATSAEASAQSRVTLELDGVDAGTCVDIDSVKLKFD